MCEEWFQNEDLLEVKSIDIRHIALFLYQMADVKFIFGNFIFNFHFDKDY